MNHVEYTCAKTRFDFTIFHAYKAMALSVRDRLIERLNDTSESVEEQKLSKQHIIASEFMLGKRLRLNLVNIGLEDQFKQALHNLGNFNLDLIYEQEAEKSLGMAGLGITTASLLEQKASMAKPAWGYCIRYDYGSFEQRFDVEGRQLEKPDFWDDQGRPWEIPRQDVCYKVHFGGRVRKKVESPSDKSMEWEPEETILAMAYDIPIPGFDTMHCNCLRLWGAKPVSEFDLELFNEGEYYKAIEQQMRAGLITSVLDYSKVGRDKQELRLKQEYFLCAASTRDIVERFKFQHCEQRPGSSASSISLSEEEQKGENVYAGPITAINWINFAKENEILLNDT